ncbi:mechanosensitive ion channel family protein [Diaminobutyricimonas aerilata]|nr:mechanosensitive ion channel domain-containing protein [Diaminobutyricimonas aerilata]
MPWLEFAAWVLGALIAAVAIAALVAVIVRSLAKRRGWDERHIGRVRRPFRVLLFLVGLWIAVGVAFPSRDLIVPLDTTLRLLVIGASGWLGAGIVSFAFESVLGRWRTDVADNRVARRVRTQVLILRRVVVVIIAIVTLGAMLLTFPEVRAVGTSLLASAGVASIVAGLAAQSVLANMFAGVQLAFSDAIRVDDVVVVEGEWGTIEEITLTYVVVHIWDDRRLVLPSTYFTSTPFENWTRRNSELLGSVEFDLDWRVAPSAMREELDRILARTDLWDGRVKVLQVTDAVGGFVRIRVLVTAKDAPTLFDLRCFVREELIEWMHEHAGSALPRQRVQLVEQEHRPQRRDAVSEHNGLFSGSIEAQQRASDFTTAIPLPDLDDEPESDLAERARGRGDS